MENARHLWTSNAVTNFVANEIAQPLAAFRKILSKP
jgi:hypothetical protein